MINLAKEPVDEVKEENVDESKLIFCYYKEK
jgi:hypothetical protein